MPVQAPLMEPTSQNDIVNAHRIRKRTNGVDAIKRSPEYTYARRALAEGRIESLPVEPDPTDMTVSKRKWEAGIQHWRRTLQQIVVQFSPPPNTAHDIVYF